MKTQCFDWRWINNSVNEVFYKKKDLQKQIFHFKPNFEQCKKGINSNVILKNAI